MCELCQYLIGCVKTIQSSIQIIFISIAINITVCKYLFFQTLFLLKSLFYLFLFPILTIAVFFIPCKAHNIYRPQTKLCKVMFLHVSVILVIGGGCHMVGHMVHLPGRHLPGRHPPPDGQWAGGTHPTGMHSCVLLKLFTQDVLN